MLSNIMQDAAKSKLFFLTHFSQTFHFYTPWKRHMNRIRLPQAYITHLVTTHLMTTNLRAKDQGI